MNKVILVLNTIKYLRFRQLFFRLYYVIRSKYRRYTNFEYPSILSCQSFPLTFNTMIEYEEIYRDQKFKFLNIEHKFDNGIDWNYNKYGKLWTYNLVYFDFLNQDKIDVNEAIDLILDFNDREKGLKDALEPFPISLRTMNIIKFLIQNSVNNEQIDRMLFKHTNILYDNLEYHLYGNHLLENGFALLFSSYYFQNEKFYQKAKEILIIELDEQILNDGAHFELSPMYHQIMLYRVLECINVIKNNLWKEKELLEFLSKKASLMLGWLKNISYSNGEIPLFNDSANGIAPSSNLLYNYADKLNINIEMQSLSDSGYRKVMRDNYECIIDIGAIGASYIPGHAHADTFNFEIYVNSNPFIVDMGLSTYQISDQRDLERATSSHNTVTINNDQNSSQVWSGFRVANRAQVIDIDENESSIKATHDGYKDLNVLHTREWNFEDKMIVIKDKLDTSIEGVSRLHFYPGVSEEKIKESIEVENGTYKIKEYYFAEAFNTLKSANCVEISFKSHCKVTIKL